MLPAWGEIVLVVVVVVVGWWFSVWCCFRGERKKGMELSVRSLKWDSCRGVKVDVWKGWVVESSGK